MLRNAVFTLLLVVAVIPALAAGNPPVPTEAFFHHPLYSFVAISPDGETLALVGPVQGDTTQTQLEFMDLATGRLRSHYILRGGQQARDIWWVSNDRVVFSTIVDYGGFDLPVPTGWLYQADARGDRYGTVGIGAMLATLHDHPGYVVFGTRGTVTADLSNYDDPRYVSRRGAPENTWVTVDHSGSARLALGTNLLTGAPKFFSHPPGDSMSDWVNISSFAGGEDPYSAFGPAQFTADDRQFYYVGFTPAGTLGLYLVDAVTLEKTPVYDDPGYDVDNEFSPTVWLDSFDGKTPVSFQYQAERPRWIVVDKAAPEATWLAALQDAFPGEALQITSTAWDGSKAVVYVYSDTDPGRYFVYDTQTRKLRFLFAVRPDIEPAEMAAMQPVTFKARDGLTIHGYLTLPKNGRKNLPLVVHPHGGPFGMRDVWGFDPEVQFLAYHGYAVLQVDFRGSGGYGTAFQQAGYRQWGGKMQDDLTDATRWAIDQGIADPKRICIYGASYGGYAALEGVEKEPELYRCAVGYAGVYDLIQYRGQAGYIFGRDLKSFMRTTLGSDAATLQQYSPYLHVDRIKAALLLIHGGEDKVVDISQADELRDALDAIKKPYQWVYYPHEGHGYYALDHQVDVYTKMLAFFDKNIGPGAAQP